MSKRSVPLAPKELTDEVEETVLRGSADGIMVTGTATGKRTAIEDLKKAVIVAKGTPVLAGSGVDPTNAAAVLTVADAVFCSVLRPIAKIER